MSEESVDVSVVDNEVESSQEAAPAAVVGTLQAHASIDIEKFGECARFDGELTLDGQRCSVKGAVKVEPNYRTGKFQFAGQLDETFPIDSSAIDVKLVVTEVQGAGVLLMSFEKDGKVVGVLVGPYRDLAVGALAAGQCQIAKEA